MAKSARKIIAQLTQPKYALLKDLTDLAALDAPGLQAAIAQAVADRLALAGGLLRAAVVIGKHEDPITRRSAVSRAYYGAYQAARATVFGVHGRDEGDHDRVAQLVDEIVRGQGSVQTALKELRDLRNEMDYSPYPGISGDTEYDEESLERVIGDSTKKAENLVAMFVKFLAERK